MFYKVSADLTVFLHLLWILFLILGAFPGRKYASVKVIHIAGLSFAALMQTFDWYCPLTYLEVWLRRRHDPSLSYSGSFIVHYLEQLVYIEIPPSVVSILTALIIIISAYLYVRKKD